MSKYQTQKSVRSSEAMLFSNLSSSTGNKAGTTLAQWLSQTKKEDPWTGFSVGEGSMMKADDEMLIAEEVEILDVVEDSESVQVKVGSTEDTK